MPDRRYFLARLGRILGRARHRHDTLIAVLVIDLDRISLVNSSLGYQAGDRLILEATKRLKRCVRARDTLARFGGDEFAILLNGIEKEQDAMTAAGRVLEILSKPYSLNGQEVFTSASIGIAMTLNGDNSAEGLLQKANAALYRAKAGGRARIEVFDVSMAAQANERLSLESEIRRALANDEFEMHYQPIVRLDRVQAIGFEALLRWRHPQRGMIPPDQFLPLAEENGLIHQIGRWTLENSLGQAARWKCEHPKAAPLLLAVNVSGTQFDRPDLVGTVEAVLRDTRFPAQDLVVEITESAILDSSEHVMTALKELKGMGIRLCVDDFGTGYATLSSLHRFPFDHLKIDRSFVNQMITTRKTFELVRTVVSMAHGMGIESVAEGIETMDQANLLRVLGCPYGQGFLFAKPLAAAQVPTEVFIPKDQAGRLHNA